MRDTRKKLSIWFSPGMGHSSRASSESMAAEPSTSLSAASNTSLGSPVEVCLASFPCPSPEERPPQAASAKARKRRRFFNEQ